MIEGQAWEGDPKTLLFRREDGGGAGRKFIWKGMGVLSDPPPTGPLGAALPGMGGRGAALEGLCLWGLFVGERAGSGRWIHCILS